jgi:hypothetical protein
VAESVILNKYRHHGTIGTESTDEESENRFSTRYQWGISATGTASEDSVTAFREYQ